MENTTQSTIIYFDRHESMSSETRSEVLQIINKLKLLGDTFKMQNYLYGLFDGYNYYLTDDFETSFMYIAQQDVKLAECINILYGDVISEYTQTASPNNGVH